MSQYYQQTSSPLSNHKKRLTDDVEAVTIEDIPNQWDLTTFRLAKDNALHWPLGVMIMLITLSLCLWIANSRSLFTGVMLSEYPEVIAPLGPSVGIADDDGCDDECGLTEHCSNPIYGPVMGGLDLVATYHSYNKTAIALGQFPDAVKGSPSISITYGVSAVNHSMPYTFHFATTENRDLFIANPSQYIPQYGGFCSWGIANEYCPSYTWSADCLGPSGNWYYYLAHDNKLYFFLKDSAYELFTEDIETHASEGDSRWVKWFGGLDDSSKKREGNGDSDYGSDKLLVLNTNCYDTTV